MKFFSASKTTIALFLLAACASDATGPTVSSTTTSLSISVGSANLNVGDATQAVVTFRDAAGHTLRVTGDSVAWKSSNSNVASVTPGVGIVTALSAGTTTISASALGKVATVDVSVTAPPGGLAGAVASLGLSLGAPTLVVGRATQALAVPKDASGNPVSGRTIAWNTSDVNVASVSDAGMVTGRGVGTAAISATADGMTASASVTIVPRRSCRRSRSRSVPRGFSPAS